MIVYIIIFLSLLLTPVSGQSSEYLPTMPTELNSTRISLLTVNDGVELYTRFGHTMLRIQDSAEDIDFVIHWGQFDFSDPLFIPKFFQGILIYSMGFAPTKRAVSYYRKTEFRGIVEDEFALTLSQKKRLMDKVKENMKPENIFYPYQYFRNNCATIPRDYIDYALSGALKASMEDVVVPTITYRDYARQNLGTNSLVAWGLDAIFNGDTDRPLRRWDEMFYPKKLREHLSTMSSYNDLGLPVAAQGLLINNHMLIDIPEPEGQAMDGYLLTWLVAGIPLFAILISLFLRRLEGKRIVLRWQNRVFGLVSLWWGMTAGFFGLTHFWGWAFSQHSDLYHNLNILLFWPIDFLLLSPAVLLGILGGDFGHENWFKRKYWRKFATVHLYIIPVYAVIACSGLVEQNTSRLIIYMVPLSLLYYFVMVRLTWQGDSAT